MDETEAEPRTCNDDIETFLELQAVFLNCHLVKVYHQVE